MCVVLKLQVCGNLVQQAQETNTGHSCHTWHFFRTKDGQKKKKKIFSALGVRHGFDPLGFCFYHNLYQAHGFSLLKYRSPYSLTSIPVWFGMNFAVIISWCFSLASKKTLKRKAWGTGYPFHSFWMGMREKQEKNLKKWHLAGTLGTVLSSTFVGHKYPDLITRSLKSLGFTGRGLGVGTDGHKCTNLPFFLPIACILQAHGLTWAISCLLLGGPQFWRSGRFQVWTLRARF